MGKRTFENEEDVWQAQHKAILQEAKRRKLDFTSKESKRKAAAKAMKNVRRIIQDMYEKPESAAYRMIDRNAHWFANYQKTIKRIVDFNIIINKFDNNRYDDAHAVADDFRTLWDNAMKFNHPNSPIWKIAWKFLQEFEKRFAKEVLPHCGSRSEHADLFSKIVTDVWSQQNGHFFHSPVQYMSMRLTNYPTIVKNPTCLRKVRDRCHSFRNEKLFLEAIDLVFDNAIAFNPSGGDIHQCAKIYKEFVRKELSKGTSDAFDTFDLEYEEEEEPTKTTAEAETEQKEDDSSIMTQEQMEWLSEHFYELDDDRLSPIVEKLQKYSKEDETEDEPTIDLSELPPKILHEAYIYVKESLQVQKQMNEGAGITIPNQVGSGF